ncbi:DUF6470 family protein [Pseudalkalibacillus salsuginis]|uniref:DUF6470 family protein n=1 Tax=Pseudalkalibacillus salsuginis TaxID=2910972 RepID=UPI001F30EA1A|nr:DUF6470 family protein [Pseudalkalibacillus salsuginis]MCF6410149.1 DUF6470 family protein [Pseudalkalibacillus salsuginis]
MQIPQIRIQSQPALIGLETTKGVQQIRQPKAEQSIQQPKADLNVKTTKGIMTIDQTKAWNDMDLKSVFVRTEEAAHLGREDLLSGIARRAQEGDQLMRIENGGNPIAEQARVNSGGEMREWNIGWIPSAGSVKLNYWPANVDIDVQVNKPNIETVAKKPEHTYQPGKVDVFLRQRNSVSINFV